VEISSWAEFCTTVVSTDESGVFGFRREGAVTKAVGYQLGAIRRGNVRGRSEDPYWLIDLKVFKGSGIVGVKLDGIPGGGGTVRRTTPGPLHD